ncbi:MAG: hypothetical protein HOW73_24460 [Polyangiaceae bacterium]|nr:hypothetical protein [Polyangiaceae bacterium]
MRPGSAIRRSAVGLAAVLVGCFGEFGEYQTGSGGSGAAGPCDQDEEACPEGAAPSVGGSSAQGSGGAADDAELCTNRNDDDDDGLIDCEDANDCGGFVCVSLLPDPQWIGPLVVRGADDACPAGYPDAGPAGAVLADAANPCGCTCGQPTNVSCQALLTLYEDNQCVEPSESIDLQATCAAGSGAPFASAKATPQLLTGSCDASPTNPAIPFESLKTCLGAGAGCEEGVCARPTGPDEVVCIAAMGDQPCTARFPTKKVLYPSPPTDPSCSQADCSCGAPAGVDCVGNVSLFDVCGGTSQLGFASGGCADLGGPTSFGGALFAATPKAGSCAPISNVDLTRFGEITTLCCGPGF